MPTYYVSAATGSDADDGLSEANAWLTIDKAMNTVVAGDKVWVKADGTYAETATIDTTGTINNPITFEGYTATIGDGGQATIDGASVRASGIVDSIAAGGRVYYVFKNFRITGHTSHGVNTDQLHLVFKNCKLDTNGGSGFNGRHAMFEACELSSNTGDGATIGTTGVGVFIGCRIFSNGQDGINCSVGLLCAFCEFYSNNSAAISAGAANDGVGFVAIINCTIDGDAKDSTDAVLTNVAFHPEIVIVNSILYDCITGVTANHGAFENHISRNNLVNANTTAYAGFNTPTGEVTSAPQFTNEGAQDYTLGASSPARNAGYAKGGNGADIGAFQMTDAAGVGGGPTAIRTGGGL